MIWPQNQRWWFREQTCSRDVAHYTPALIAFLLVLTGVLKFHFAVSQPPVDSGILSSRWALILIAQLEWTLAAWLLTGFRRHMAWRVLVFVFVGFLLISVTQAVQGESCHCFGVVTVPPGFSLFVDLTVLGLLYCSRQVWRDCPSKFGTRLVIVIAVLFVMGSSASAYALTYHERRDVRSEGAIIIGHGHNVLLEPESWLGKRFPLLDFVGDEDLLSKGDWEVWIYRHNCPECSRALRSIGKRQDESRLAILELPPFASDRITQEDVVWFQADERYSWFGETPIRLNLSSGIVTLLGGKGSH